MGRSGRRPASAPFYKPVHRAEDIALLTEVDEAHEKSSGPATQRILRREFMVYGRQYYQRLPEMVGSLPTYMYRFQLLESPV